MFNKKFIIIFIISLLYQSPLFSKSTSFDEINSKNLSNYFSGIVAFENKDNSEALSYFNSSKILINQHDPYLKKFVMSLVLEDKVGQAINFIKLNNKKSNSNFFEAYILLALDNLKKKDINKTLEILANIPEILKKDRFNFIILNSLEQYAQVFKNKKILQGNQKFGNLSFISETFQRCYLGDSKTDSYFSNLINNGEADYSRYIFFYLTYLIENKRIDEAKLITDE